MKKKQQKILKFFLFIMINTVVIAVSIGVGRQKSVTAFSEQNDDEAYGNKILNIHTVEEYLEFAETVSWKNNYEHWEIRICSDLDFSEYDNVPVIGDAAEDEEPAPFKGKIEGAGHKISGIKMIRPTGRSAMFAMFCGTVKNLRIEDCCFEGNISGAVGAECEEANILNCYFEVDAAGETAGAAAGIFSGNIYNCVSTSEIAGQFSGGIMENCYLSGGEDIAALNDMLHELSGGYQDSLFCLWGNSREKVVLTNEKAELLETMTARLLVGNKEIKLNGFYSMTDRRWYIVLPAGYGNTELFMETVTAEGKRENFTRKENEAQILYTFGEHSFLIEYICADEIDTLYVQLDDDKALSDVYKDQKIEFPGKLLILEADGKISHISVKGFYGHGNSSWEADKKSFNLKLEDRVNLLNMGKNEDFALLAGYRMNSLMSYCTSGELVKALEFEYAPEFRMVNLYVEGDYVGVYFLTEKIELDENRIDLQNLAKETKKINSQSLDSFEYCMDLNEETQEKKYYYNIEKNPEDITGGYLLEMDVADYDPEVSRFITKDRYNKITLKRAKYSTKEQVYYISGFWQEFEDALLSENGYNDKGKYYADYIDLDSFVLQWLMYELNQEDSMRSSIYYYKKSDVSGDGLIHACYPWDMERSYMMLDQLDAFWNVDVKGGYWAAFYNHEDFRERVKEIWSEKFIPVINFMISPEPNETENSVKNLEWYRQNIGQISYLEHVRWNKTNMLEKCDTIREVLTVRKEVLTRIFGAQ